MPSRAKKHRLHPPKQRRRKLGWSHGDRENANKLFYVQTRWKKLRHWFLNQHPLCSCGHAATVVDHIVSRYEKPELQWDVSNMQALCKPCHDKKTASDQRVKKIARKRAELAERLRK